MPHGLAPSDDFPGTSINHLGSEAVDFWSAVITLAAALGGAWVGGLLTARAESANRTADRRRQCIERLVEHTYRLEAAYVEYNRTSDEALAGVALQSAVRSHSIAVELVDDEKLRSDWHSYAQHMLAHYLFLGEAPDPMDYNTDVPTADQLATELVGLTQSLRDYESK